MPCEYEDEKRARCDAVDGLIFLLLNSFSTHLSYADMFFFLLAAYLISFLLVEPTLLPHLCIPSGVYFHLKPISHLPWSTGKHIRVVVGKVSSFLFCALLMFSHEPAVDQCCATLLWYTPCEGGESLGDQRGENGEMRSCFDRGVRRAVKQLTLNFGGSKVLSPLCVSRTGKQ